MKLIIAGSRTFNDYRWLEKVCNWFLVSNNFLIEGYDEVLVVSGGAKGADELGERYAKQYGWAVRQFLPDWHKHGRSAGAIRNKEMADFATHCICFWDGKSRGTKMMIDFAKQRGLVLHVELLSSDPNPERSVATEADSSTNPD